MARQQQRQRGVTLIELMVIMTFLGLIAAMVAVLVMGMFGRVNQWWMLLDCVLLLALLSYVERKVRPSETQETPRAPGGDGDDQDLSSLDRDKRSGS
jgi:general secretion pathway protein G